MMSDKKYLFNGKDISINVYVQIRTVVNVIMERTQKTFMEAVEIFYMGFWTFVSEIDSRYYGWK